MKLRKVKSLGDIKKCIELYRAFNDESFLLTDEYTSIRSLSKRWLSEGFIRVIEVDDKIVGWIAGEITKLEFLKFPIMRQLYYFADLKGFSAAKAVVLAHGALVQEAEQWEIPLVMSTCGITDEKHLMCKILSKHGWVARGHTAIFKTSFHLSKRNKHGTLSNNGN